MGFPAQILGKAIRAVPAVKYALGIAGVVAAIAIVESMHIKLQPRRTWNSCDVGSDDDPRRFCSDREDDKRADAYARPRFHMVCAALDDGDGIFAIHVCFFWHSCRFAKRLYAS